MSKSANTLLGIFVSFALMVATLSGCYKSSVEYRADDQTLAAGKELFVTYCTSCHAIQAPGFGPRLGGITRLLRKAELMEFVRDPAQVIKSGNERAVAQQARYKQTMPPFASLTEEELHSILAYIDQQTEEFDIAPLDQDEETPSSGLRGRLVKPITKSTVKIELQEVARLVQDNDVSPDLGISTLRPHPSRDGTLFISDQEGILYRVKDGKAEVFLKMQDHITNFSVGPGLATGLGSFDFHPDFLNNGLLYITHAEIYEHQRPDYTVTDSSMSEVQWVLSEWKVNNIKDKVFKGSRREILRLHGPTFGHSAQEISFIPDLDKKDLQYGLLYFGFGDGGSNNIRRPELGHHLRSFLGTIMRIDPRGTNSRNGNYGIPADNPFAKDQGQLVLQEIWAFGFRNPHRMTWDAAHGQRMMVTDIGESNIEELNIVEKGGDYGWPLREGNLGIATKQDLKTVFALGKSDREIYKGPFAQYDHEDGFAISGGHVYGGDIDALKGKYVFGDIVNGKLFYANIDGVLSDSTVYELGISRQGVETTMKELTGLNRLHLRVAYDRFANQLYIITKADGRIWRVTNAVK